MALRLLAMAPLARGAAATAAAAISISISAFQAGPASAAASPLPIGGVFSAISCTSGSSCAAVGQLDLPHGLAPLVVSEKNGIWGKAETVPGLSALPDRRRVAGLVSVSCSSAGNCGAGGFFEQHGPSVPGDGPPSQALVVTERNGVWGKAEAVPGLAALNAGQEANTFFMSCRSAGSCTAAGSYIPNSTTDGASQVFVVSEKNGTWGKAENIPGLDAIDNDRGGPGALSCVSPGNCTIAGSYTAGKVLAPFAASQKNGVWDPVQAFPAFAAAGESASIDALSCWSSGDCTGTGVYLTSDRRLDVFAISETNGTWGAATVIPGFTALPGGQAFSISDTSLSCPSAGNCTAGGTFTNSGDGSLPFVAAERNGTWGRAEVLPGLMAVDPGQVSFFDGLVCYSPGNCTAAGRYAPRAGSSYVIYVSAEKNGKWGKPERLPGSAALPDIGFGRLAISCDAPGNCGIGGNYSTNGSDKPWVDTERNGTWRKAERVPGIRP